MKKRNLYLVSLIIVLSICCAIAFSACTGNVTGTYKFSKATWVTTMNGKEVRVEGTDTYADFFNCENNYITLNEDGTGESNNGTLTWTQDGKKITIIHESGSESTYTFKNNSLISEATGSAGWEVTYKKS
ncbi:MAG: hypothetical protein K2H36_07250 [Clostridia bacterium]|nr:hypothetical protein [Clostridia bacterium]MDE6758140.1 hypothetical protein [Clostridia bacterium]